MARFGALVIVAALATAAFGTQINLVTPNGYRHQLTSNPIAATGRYLEFTSHRLFDEKLDTGVTVDTDESNYGSRLYYRYEVKVHRYKIYVGEGTDPSWFPKAWTLTASTGVGSKRVKRRLDKVTNAQFVNGVYAAKVRNPGKYERIQLDITEDSTPNDNRLKIKMAEIKYFGPRAQYDRFVDGGYLCKNAPVYVTKADGKTRAQGGVPFSSDDTRSPKELNKLFNDWSGYGQRIYLRNHSVIIGYHFPKALTVVQFYIGGLWRGIGQFQGNLKLEGHKCDPTCDYLGRDGWVSLSRGDMRRHYDRKFLVQRPGSYRAYRIRYDKGWGKFVDSFSEVSFLQCADGDEI